MNSTLQQLFMIPSFSKTLFQLGDPDFNKEGIKDNILFQLKVIILKDNILTLTAAILWNDSR